MKKLHLHAASGIDSLASPPERAGLTLASPALDFFTDFTVVEPLVIESTVSALEARRLM